MKKIIFILLIIHCSLSIANSQWIQQYTGTNQNFYDLRFLNENTGWIVGTSGALMKTTNGGINWIQMGFPVGGRTFNSVCIVDSNNVFVCGYFETVIKTTDGGNNWVIIRNYGQGESYFGIYFINKNTGWVCGSNSKVLRTTDGGQTSDSVYAGAGYLNDMYFKDANTGLACGDGFVVKTTNAGLNWHLTLSPPWAYIFRKINFVNNIYGWVCALNGQSIFRTTNFGNNWVKIDSSIGGLSSVYFINRDTGFVGGPINTLYKTINGGFNWKRENTITSNQQFEAIKFVNDTVGWVAATGGVVLHTTTGGQTLVKINNIAKTGPTEYKLNQNYPNPFNSQTTIKYKISKTSDVKIEIYNLLGQKMGDLINEKQNPGTYEIIFNGNNLSSGIYFYTLFVDNKLIETKKLTLIK